MKTSSTRVIFKKGDRKSLKNWRPISLLNVDYKICSKAISIRLSKVLEYIVDPDQTCAVPGRKISSNLHALRDILDYIERTGETGILRATACKYEESSDRTKILDFFLFHPKNPFGELLSKIVLKSSIALLFLRKIEKLKISDGRRLTPRKMMEIRAISSSSFTKTESNPDLPLC